MDKCVINPFIYGVAFTTVPFKPLSEQEWIFFSLYLIIFNCGFSIKMICGFLHLPKQWNIQLSELNTFQAGESIKSTMYMRYLHVYMFTFIICIKEAFSVRLFGCPIITHEPLHRFSSNFDLGTWENHGKVLSFVLRF